jgi:exopolysaccharide biosynthesis polyprenyl glycosylphosphotransferase
VLIAPPETEQDETRAVADTAADRDVAWPDLEAVPLRRPSALRRRLVALDVLSLVLGWTSGWIVVGEGFAGPIVALSTGIGMIVLGVAVSLLAFSVAGLYRPPLNGIRSGALARLVQCVGIAGVVVMAWQAVTEDVLPGLAIGSAVFALLVVVLARYAFDVWLIGRREQGDFRTPVVVAGAANETTTLVDFLQLNPEAGFEPTAIVGERPMVSSEAVSVAPYLGPLGRACDAVLETGATAVVVAANGLPSDTVNELVHQLSQAGIPVHLSSGLTGISRARLDNVALAHEPVVLVRPPRRSRIEAVAKRAVDIVLATALLVLVAPVLAAAALLIKAHDRGPVLFRQVRVGKDGRTFTVLKLRTMEVDAEARLAELRHHNERNGPLFKVTNDPRVTPIGGFLRASALDEVPQLFNVLAGSMSIVGPRPALPLETAEFDDELQRRHLVRPGVTGLWQVEANHKASFDEYRRLDLFYVDNWSIGLDLAIIIDTLPAVTRRALRALRRPAPSAPAPVASPTSVPQPAEASS